MKFQRKQRLYRAFCRKTLWYLEAGTEESTVIKRPALLKETSEALERWMLVGWKGEIRSD